MYEPLNDAFLKFPNRCRSGNLETEIPAQRLEADLARGRAQEKTRRSAQKRLDFPRKQSVCVAAGEPRTLDACTPSPRGRADPALASVTEPDWPAPLGTRGFYNGL